MKLNQVDLILILIALCSIRAPLYTAKYTVLSVTQPTAAPDHTYTVVGKFCESGDYLARDVQLPKVECGDVLAVPVSGAYHLSMSSNYNQYLRPPVVFVAGGKARLVQRRETYADLMARDVY